MRSLLVSLLFFVASASMSHARYNDINYVLNVSGGSYISVPNSNSLNNQLVLGLRFSIDAWIKPGAIGNEMAIVGNGFAYWFGLDANGRLQLRLNGTQYFHGTAIIPVGVWTHAAVTVDIIASSITFYINQALDKSISHTGSLSGNTGVLCIGADIGGAGAPAVLTPWTGAIDEVHIWRTALDYPNGLGRIHMIPYSVRWGRYGQYLVSAWRLNGSGVDFCGGNHGTPVGSCTYSNSSLPPFYDRIGLGFLRDDIFPRHGA